MLNLKPKATSNPAKLLSTYMTNGQVPFASWAVMFRFLAIACYSIQMVILCLINLQVMTSFKCVTQCVLPTDITNEN